MTGSVLWALDDLFPGGGPYSGLDVSRPPLSATGLVDYRWSISERSLTKDLHIPKRPGRFLFLIRRLYVKR